MKDSSKEFMFSIVFSKFIFILKWKLNKIINNTNCKLNNS